MQNIEENDPSISIFFKIIKNELVQQVIKEFVGLK